MPYEDKWPAQPVDLINVRTYADTQKALRDERGNVPGNARILVRRQRTVEAIGLRQRRRRSRGIAVEADLRGVIAQALDGRVELRRDKGPHLFAGSNAAAARVEAGAAVAIDRSQHAVIGAVEHHDRR